MFNHYVHLFKIDDKLVVATSRPETIFGDVALAVNPDDCRYAEFVGKYVVNPLNGLVIPVVVDGRVKADFGTGKIISYFYQWHIDTSKLLVIDSYVFLN